MTAVFLKLVNMSLIAGVPALAVMLFRAVFRKAPKWLTVALWGLVALRLLVPVSIQSPTSLLPSAAPVKVHPVQRIVTPDTQEIQVQTGIDAIDKPLNELFDVPATVPLEIPTPKPSPSLPQVLSVVWACGAGLMLVYALASTLRLRQKIGASLQLEQGAYLTDGIGSPFILGVFRPRIYLPSNLEEAQREPVLRHERAHLRRHDHWWKPLGFALLAVYWFNPVLWVAYVLLCRDIELACDEKVIRDLDREQRAEYTQALLDCRHPRAVISACPVAFGEVGVKTRVKQVLNYKKPAFWVIVVALLASAVLAICFLTDPKRNTQTTPELEAAISSALLSHRALYFGEEFAAEGHITLGVEEGSDGIKETANAYVLVETSSFGFQNGWFQEQSGSVMAAVLTFEKAALLGDDHPVYMLKTLDYPSDGALFTPSVKKLFPRSCRSRVLRMSDADRKTLWETCKEKAEDYLKSIGRSDSRVVRYGDVEHILTTDRGVSEKAMDQIRSQPALVPYKTDELGWCEAVESGTRYTYRTAMLYDTMTLLCTKEIRGTDEVKELILTDTKTGEVLWDSRAENIETLYRFSARATDQPEKAYRLMMPTRDDLWTAGVLVNTETISPQCTNAAKGDYVEIYFNYPVAESRPEQMPTVYAICALGDVYEFGAEALPETTAPAPETRP